MPFKTKPETKHDWKSIWPLVQSRLASGLEQQAIADELGINYWTLLGKIQRQRKKARKEQARQAEDNPSLVQEQVKQAEDETGILKLVPKAFERLAANLDSASPQTAQKAAEKVLEAAGHLKRQDRQDKSPYESWVSSKLVTRILECAKSLNVTVVSQSDGLASTDQTEMHKPS